ADLHVSPVPTAPVVPGQVRRRKTPSHALQLDAIGQDAGIAAGARILDCDARVRGSIVERFPEHLGVAEEQHAVGPPVVEDVREYVDIHELTVGLSAADLLPLSPCVAETNRGQ